MRFLVTRPVEDAARTAERLRTAGHEALIEPLLTIRFHDDFPLAQTDVQALLATSANGLRALDARADAKDWHDVPLFAVGETTGALARAQGFTHVFEAGGDVIALQALVKQQCRRDGGRLIHISGRVSAGDLVGDLTASGYESEKVVLYDAVAASAFSDELVQALKTGQIDGVLLYSPRTAEIFAGLVHAAGLKDACATIDAFCLSSNAAAPLRHIGFKAIHIAEKPSDNALFALIGP